MWVNPLKKLSIRGSVFIIGLISGSAPDWLKTPNKNNTDFHKISMVMVKKEIEKIVYVETPYINIYIITSKLLLLLLLLILLSLLLFYLIILLI